jgi:hypothetical protein
MFEVGKFYTHPGMYDCVLKVMSSHKDVNDDYSLNILPVLKSGVILGFTEYVTIKKEDAHKWKEYSKMENV